VRLQPFRGYRISLGHVRARRNCGCVVSLARFLARANSEVLDQRPRGAFPRRSSIQVHLALYASMFVIPIIGFVTFIYSTIFEPTEDIHGYLAYAPFAPAGLHAFAAMWHHFVLHDGVLARI
jgi:cytochrome b561